MESMRSTWTDERMDDLNSRVDELGRHMDARFDSVDRCFEAIDRRFDSIDRRIETLEVRMDHRLDTLQYTMVRIGAGMFATMAIGFIGLVVAHA